MNDREIRISEECLYMRKYLYGRIAELDIELETKLPQLPGSVLKMVGKPVAKTPLDTSQTESWGIYRATCREAVELSAKRRLHSILKDFKGELIFPENEFVKLKYEKELPPKRVKENMGITHTEYYTIRLRVLRNLWKVIRNINDIENAIQ